MHYWTLIMVNGVCSYCGSITGHKKSNGSWYSSVTGDSLYFLCSNCYAKQTEWNPSQKNRKGLDVKQKISIIMQSKLKTSFVQKIIMKAME